MVDPNTNNILLAVPTHGSDIGTWDSPMNNNYSSIDGFIGGVTTISVSNSPVTLTSPSGSLAISGGPTQSQNRILKFTGTLTANVVITLPLPGEYTVQNLTTGNFLLSYRAVTLGKVIATPQGSVMHIWNDGTDVWLHKSAFPGQMIFMGGVTTTPSWILAGCTINPFLLCDGGVYNISSFPALGALFGATFGGNGSTTFGVPDLRGRYPMQIDSTGSRITVGVCSLNGNSLGAAGGNQNPHAHNHGVSDPTHTHSSNAGTGAVYSSSGADGPFAFPQGGTTATINAASTGITITTTFSGSSGNVPPTQVSGIWLVAT